MRSAISRGVFAFVSVLCLAAATRAAVIVPGLYTLGDHPDASIDPPTYGLRLNELVNATGGFDFFTFSFDHPQSNMSLVYNNAAQTIRIFGQTMGGRDVGSDWANDSFRGIYQIDFLYNVGVQMAPGDDDLIVVAATGSNSGTITLPNGTTILLLNDVRSSGDGYTFRLGDEDNDLGHRGFPGISGWGWLMVNGVRNDLQDWNFTATFIPEPATAGLASPLAMAMLLRRRRGTAAR
jgi:hypothetical protein